VNRGDDAEEGISGRVKPSPSREAVEAISIHRAITQAVLRRRKRAPAGDGMSEVKSRTERDHERQRQGETRRGSRGRITLLVAAWPTEAGPARRETTDPPIAPDGP